MGGMGGSGRRERASELKAARSAPKVIRQLLMALAGERCGVYAVIVDKGKFGRMDPEEAYRRAIGTLLFSVVQDFPRLNVVLDKRYTNRRQRLALERVIREQIADIPNQVVVGL